MLDARKSPTWRFEHMPEVVDPSRHVELGYATDHERWTYDRFVGSWARR